MSDWMPSGAVWRLCFQILVRHISDSIIWILYWCCMIMKDRGQPRRTANKSFEWIYESNWLSNPLLNIYFVFGSRRKRKNCFIFNSTSQGFSDFSACIRYWSITYLGQDFVKSTIGNYEKYWYNYASIESYTGYQTAKKDTKSNHKR